MKKVVLTVVCLFVLSSVAMAAPLMDFEKGKASIDYTYRPSLDFKGSLGIEGSSVYKENGTVVDQENLENGYFPFSLDGKANMDWGITLGMGKGFALQYKQLNAATDRYAYRLGSYDNSEGTYIDRGFSEITLKGKLRSDEFNVLYKVGKNFAAFTGVVRASLNVEPGYNQAEEWAYDGETGNNSVSLNLPGLKSADKNMWHIGLVGIAPLAKKTDAYGIVSVGNDYRNWEAGISYKISKDIDFNVNYRNVKFDKLNFGSLRMSSYESYPEANSLTATATPTYTQESIVTGEANVKDLELKGWGFGLTFKF